MNLIKPFKGIILNPNINQKLSGYSFNNEKYAYLIEKELINNQNLLTQDILIKINTSAYYCCRISNNFFSSTGLITKINIKFLNKIIFGHEQCINSKINAYSNFFKNYKMQINPIILGHENDKNINEYLFQVTLNKIPLIKAKIYNYLYEIWLLKDFHTIYYLYNSLNKFLITDGHHRVSAIYEKCKDKFSLAFLAQFNELHTVNICRIYNKLSSDQKALFISTLKKYFSLQKLEKLLLIDNFQQFIIIVNKTIYVIKNSNENYIKEKVLNYLNQFINYDEKGEPNFANFKITDVNLNHFLDHDHNTQLTCLIPAIDLRNVVHYNICYPPHSSWVEPKLPDNLISSELEEFF